MGKFCRWLSILITKIFNTFVRLNITNRFTLNILARTRILKQECTRFDGEWIECRTKPTLKIRWITPIKLKIIRFIFSLLWFSEILFTTCLSKIVAASCFLSQFILFQKLETTFRTVCFGMYIRLVFRTPFVLFFHINTFNRNAPETPTLNSLNQLNI